MAGTSHTPRGLATRDRLVRATVTIIEQQGLAALSVSEVLRHAEASKSQLYDHFESRDDLVLAAVRARAGDVVELQEQVMDRLETWTQIQEWFDCLVQMQVDGDSRGGCPLASLTGALADHDEAARTVLVDAFDAWEQMLERGLRAMRDRGELAPSARPAQLATVTMAAVQGGLVLTQVRRDPNQLRVALDAAMAHLRSAAPR